MILSMGVVGLAIVLFKGNAVDKADSAGWRTDRGWVILEPVHIKGTGRVVHKNQV